MTTVKTDSWHDRDHSKLRHNETDLSNEQRVADAIATAWKCIPHPFAKTAPIDWWLEKEGKVQAFAELKTSMKPMPFALLNSRKFYALTTVAAGFQCRALYFNQQPDGTIRWCDVLEVYKSETCVVGSKIVSSYNDIEPALKIQFKDMKVIKQPKQ